MEKDTKEKYMLKEYFAINLKWYRFKNNYTQELLAEKCNLNSKYISDLERGKFAPSLSKIEAIAKALKIEPYMLIKPDHLKEVNELPNKIDKKIGRKRRIKSDIK